MECSLRILERAMVLEVRSLRPPHHLERDEAFWSIQLPGDRTNAPLQEVLPLARHCLPFSLSAAERREHQRLGRGIGTNSLPCLDDRTNLFRDTYGRSARPCLESTRVRMPLECGSVACLEEPLKRDLLIGSDAGRGFCWGSGVLQNQCVQHLLRLPFRRTGFGTERNVAPLMRIRNSSASRERKQVPRANGYSTCGESRPKKELRSVHFAEVHQLVQKFDQCVYAC